MLSHVGTAGLVSLPLQINILALGGNSGYILSMFNYMKRGRDECISGIHNH